MDDGNPMLILVHLERAEWRSSQQGGASRIPLGLLIVLEFHGWAWAQPLWFLVLSGSVCIFPVYMRFATFLGPF